MFADEVEHSFGEVFNDARATKDLELGATALFEQVVYLPFHVEQRLHGNPVCVCVCGGGGGGGTIKGNSRNNHEHMYTYQGRI